MVEIKSERPVAVDHGTSADEFGKMAAPTGAHDRLGIADIGEVAIGGELLKRALGAGTESAAYGRNFGKVSAASFGSAQSQPERVEDDPSQVVEMGVRPEIAKYYSGDLGSSRRNVVSSDGVATLTRNGSAGWTPSLN